jgi:dihydroorotate dehydrogenase (NAD+) catalytic subunit
MPHFKGGKVIKQNRIGQTLLGHELTSPVIVSSGFLTRNVELLQKAEKYGAGGATIKSVSFSVATEVPGNFRPDVTVLPGGKSIVCPGDRRPTGPEIAGVIQGIKRQGTGMMIIGSAAGGGRDNEKWIETATKLEAAGADAIEFNASHPFVDVPPEVFMAPFADRMAPAIRAVKEAVNVPLIVKLTAVTSDLGLLAQACEEAGADAITIMNALPAAPPIDIRDGVRPISQTLENLTWTCLTGQAIFPVACYAVAHVSRKVSIPVIGCGGISSWMDVVKMIMWGASAVQICTAIHLQGFQTIDKINKGLERFMEEEGYSSIEDFRGLALKQILPQHEVKLKEDYWLTVREDRCNLCKRCLHIGQCLAISLHNDTILIDNNKCLPCGTCIQVCPKQAIEVQPRVAMRN